jgi:hypothetical protein
MKEHNLNSFADLETLFEQRLLNILKEQGTSYIVWQEIYDNGAKILPDTVIDVWKGGNWQDEIANVTRDGFHAVLSAPFYLNYISYGEDWPKYYSVEPSNFTGGEAADAKGLVGGVEVRSISLASALLVYFFPTLTAVTLALGAWAGVHVVRVCRCSQFYLAGVAARGCRLRARLVGQRRPQRHRRSDPAARVPVQASPERHRRRANHKRWQLH